MSSLIPLEKHFCQFHMVPSVEGIQSVCSFDPIPSTKIAAIRICGKKHLNIFFSRTKKAFRLNLGIQH